MFKNSLSDIFPLVHRMYDLSELILVGSNISDWLNILQKCDVNKVHYINQASLDYRFDSLPQNWEVSSKVFAQEDGETTFYEQSNSMLNGTVDGEVLAKLWQNLKTLTTAQKEAVSLTSFIKDNCTPNSSRMLIVNSFDGLSILKNLSNLDIDVVAIRVIATDEDELNFASQKNVEQKLTEWGYKNIAAYEDNHPKIKTAIFIKNAKQHVKELTAILKSKEQEFSKYKVELQNEIKELQNNLNKEKAAKESSLKERNEEKTQLENQINQLLESINQQNVNVATLQKELQEKNDTIKNLLVTKETVLKPEYLNTLTMPEKVKTIVTHVMQQENMLKSIDFYVLGHDLNEQDKFEVCCEFAQQIAKLGDKMQGVSFLNNAKLFLSKEEKLQAEQYKKLINIANILHLTLALDLEMEYNAKYGIFTDIVNKRLFNEYKKIRSVSEEQQQHGQTLLINHIEKNVKDGEGKGKILVEIGTTRENIPGQGSTLQLANLCKRKSIKFITVDMDPHNTRWANFLSKKYDLNIEAITGKGEDFLKYDIKTFDFVFLDAYDFDHGNHSKLRQSRYKKYLGSKIDEKKAHKMHLKCAKSVIKKLKKGGVLCIDDTWQNDDGEWTEKGTTAVPFILDQGWFILDQRNNAVLIGKKKK